QKPVAFFGVAQRLFKVFSLRDVARKAAKTDRLVELVLDGRNDEIEPAILAHGRARYELMPELAGFLWPCETAAKTVTFRNDTKHREERVADDFFRFATQKLLRREVDARQLARQILCEDHVAGLLDEVSITRFESRTFEQSRDFGDEASRVKR